MVHACIVYIMIILIHSLYLHTMEWCYAGIDTGRLTKLTNLASVSAAVVPKVCSSSLHKVKGLALTVISSNVDSHASSS